MRKKIEERQMIKGKTSITAYVNKEEAEEIRRYCQEEGYKISGWARKVLLKAAGVVPSYILKREEEERMERDSAEYEAALEKERESEGS